MLRVFQTFCLTLVLATAAHAELVHELFYRLPEFDAMDHSIMLDPGTTLDAKIIFRETVSGDSTAIIGGAGLGGVGFRMTAEGSDGRFSVLERPNFQISSIVNSDDTIAGASPFGGVTAVNSIGNGVFEAEVGTVQLTAPTGGETLFSFVDPQPTADNFAGLGPGTTINDSAIRFGSLSVSAVPEPGSVLALSMFAVGGLVYRRRRMARLAN